MNEKRFKTPLEAEAAFYNAFSKRDLDAMMTVWAESDDIVCVHPVDTPLVGLEAVREGWAAVLRNDREMLFAVQEKHRSENDTLAVHVVLEHIRIRGRVQPPVATTNVYRRTDGGWRMILHHASPAPEPDQATSATLH
jgi:ketosteroid isomerase-like protein